MPPHDLSLNDAVVTIDHVRDNLALLKRSLERMEPDHEIDVPGIRDLVDSIAVFPPGVHCPWPGPIPPAVEDCIPDAIREGVVLVRHLTVLAERSSYGCAVIRRFLVERVEPDGPGPLSP